MPGRQGQICKIINSRADQDPEAVYLVSEDPLPFAADDTIYIVNLRDLQRNIRNPLLTTPVPVLKNEVTVIAENLEEYIRSWNKN